jgi:hypothetical protein
MKSLRLLFILFIVFSVSVMVAHADCMPPPTVGNDTISCDNTPPPGNTEGQDGDDIIIIDTGVSAGGSYVSGGYVGVITPESGNDIIINNGYVGAIVGDGTLGDGSGDDTIINNGNVSGIHGDSSSGIGSGDDNIVNNGNAGSMTGDTLNDDGSGNDTITNNGTINGLGIFGDTSIGNGSGNDIITNSGIVNSNIYGDNQAGNGTGSDAITNSGDVNGNIIAGGGNDTVTIQGNNANVSGTIDGGADYDTLTFNLSTDDPAQAEAWAAEFAAANPNGGTITINGHIYTWTNFEELLYFIESPPPVVLPGESRRPFCAAVAGLDIYVVVGDEGVFSLYASAEEISAALSYARVYEIDEVVIETSETSQLWALITGELQVRTAEGEIVSTFLYQDYCGELPEVAAELYIVPLPTQSQEYPAYTIINQPYGGG